MVDAEQSDVGGVGPSAVPLVVDVDGTLVAGNLLFEGVLQLFRQSPLAVFRLPWLLGRPDGRAALKRRVAQSAPVSPESLVLNAEVEAVITEASRIGRSVWLASGADELAVQSLAAFVGADGYLASDGTTNLVGRTKARALINRFGTSSFDYVGNERRDLPVWEHARQAIGVNLSAHTLRRLRGLGLEPLLLAGQHGGWRAWLHVLRPHQWTKNFLVFVPILAAHVSNLDAYLAIAGIFAALSCCASGTYIFNDLLDLPHDRRHAHKHDRPIAAARVSMSVAATLGVVLIAAGLAGAFRLSDNAGICLTAYVVGTLGYSLWLKRLVFVDVITLALLYGVRIAMGAMESATPSLWLMLFSLFVFTALAIVKRQAELMDDVSSDQRRESGRGYDARDTMAMTALGAGSAFASVVVLALYVQSADTVVLYARPEMLALACPLLIYWLGRLLLLANRGLVHHDPIVFALRDRISWLVAAGIAGVVLAAVSGAA